MEISIEQLPDTLVVALVGSLDALAAPNVDKTMQDAFASVSPAKCIFRMDKVDYISSAGLRSILGVAKTMRKHKGQLIFVGIVPAVREVLDMSGFTSYFKEFPNYEDALK